MKHERKRRLADEMKPLGAHQVKKMFEDGPKVDFGSRTDLKKQCPRIAHLNFPGGEEVLVAFLGERVYIDLALVACCRMHGMMAGASLAMRGVPIMKQEDALMVDLDCAYANMWAQRAVAEDQKEKDVLSEGLKDLQIAKEKCKELYQSIVAVYPDLMF